MDLTLRPITPEEFDAFTLANGTAFGRRPTDDDRQRELPIFEFDRSVAAFDGKQIVGTAGAYSMDLTLPGGRAVPVSGVTFVGVLPTHRRQGILSAMMRALHADARRRNEPLAVLGASESTIYGRFGYGVATTSMDVEIERAHARFARQWEERGRLRILEHEQALPVAAAIYDEARRPQPAALSRSATYWQVLLHNPLASTGEQGPRFYVAYENATGTLDGIAWYRVTPAWEQGLPRHTLTVGELLARTPEAHAALWRYCLNMDLVHTVRATSRPVEDPLRWLLADPRRLRVTRMVDDLWVRPLDVPRALAERGYATSGRIVFEILDAFEPETAGCYTLEAGPDGAACDRSDDAPDLTLDVRDLGAAYLGGVAFTTLAQTGRLVEHRPGALQRADALFAVPAPPWCATPF
jgi:predicted acetyltransferase